MTGPLRSLPFERGGRWITRNASGGQTLSYWMPSVPRIDDDYLDCVFYLYASEADAEDGAHTGGSGFLVGIPTTDLPQNFVFLYAVTNRHCIKDKGTIVVRMNTTEGKNAIYPTEESAWYLHPDGDDLAILLVSINPKGIKFRHVWRSDFLDKKAVSAMSIGPGDETFVVGRFINHEGKQRNLPTARFGCIAQMPWEPIRQDHGFDQESFLVEARSIAGYSGSPVFVWIPPLTEREGVKDWIPHKIFMKHGPWLLGVDWGHINDWEPLRDEIGRPINPNPKAAQIRLNTGMMAVVPAWKLAEMLDQGPVADARQIQIERAREGMKNLTPPPATSD
jgi:hypothetical protein